MIKKAVAAVCFPNRSKRKTAETVNRHKMKTTVPIGLKFGTVTHSYKYKEDDSIKKFGNFKLVPLVILAGDANKPFWNFRSFLAEKIQNGCLY